MPKLQGLQQQTTGGCYWWPSWLDGRTDRQAENIQALAGPKYK